MASWDDGYVSEIEYTYGYYSELNPLKCILPLLFSNIAPPRKIENACELAFGQGLSTNIHAASSSIKWYGTDFIPAQADFAQELAEQSQNGAILHDLSFEDYKQLEDLPKFDFIGLHGIWSWVSAENRAHIVDFIKRQLNVGGIVYMSYNAMPGWASFAPIRHLMLEINKQENATGDGIVKNISDTIDTLNSFLEAKTKFEDAHPTLKHRLKSITNKNKHYLAHEYFNENWDPMYFSQVHEKIVEAKVEFAGSAHYLDHFDFLNIQEDQRKMLDAVKNPIHKQTLRDFVVNQQFRRDYWIKGARKLTDQQKKQALSNYSVILLKDRNDIKLTLKVATGEANLNAKIYSPILDALKDGKIHPISELLQIAEKNKINIGQLLQVMMILSTTNNLAITNPKSEITKLKKQTDKFNQTIISKGLMGQNFGYLASPVTGGGVSIPNNSLHFISAIKEGHKTADELAKYVQKILQINNQYIIRENKHIKSKEETLKLLKQDAQKFLKTEQKLYQNLHIM